MKQRRDLFILVGLFVLIFILIVLIPNDQEGGQSRRSSSHSSNPYGTQALLVWMDELGFAVERLEYRDFELESDDAALFIFDPTTPFSKEEIDHLSDWVSEGGVLLFSASNSSPMSSNPSDQLLEAFDVSTSPPSNNQVYIDRAPVNQPFFDLPPLHEVEVQTSRRLILERDDYAQLLGSPEDPIMVGFPYGFGYVYIVSSVYPFSNGGLQIEENAQFSLNILQRIPDYGRVLFDEYHHGYFQAPSLRNFLLEQAWGKGLVFVFFSVLVFLIWTGRRFGKPIPLKEEVAQRSSSEYVESMAELFQRGGKQAYISQHYHSAFKRKIARPLGINPKLDDQQFLLELQRHTLANSDQIAAVLSGLQRTNLSEKELLQLIKQADDLLKP
jgi:Na+-transporting methylmalonyl-CoA/oxaloacetate decarboxylase gamma subunit